MGTGTRIQFSDSDRRQICELHKAHPTLSHEKLTELASRQLKKPGLKRPSITGILKESQNWLNCEHSAASNKVKHRSAKHENLETVLMQWFGQMRAKGALLSNKLVSTKALSLAEKLQLADYKASDGWLSRFKKRHGIKLQRPHGESGAADMEGVDIAQTVVAKIIVELGFSMENVYNMDETGLYALQSQAQQDAGCWYACSKRLAVPAVCWILSPKHDPLVAGTVQGMKMQKDRITVAVCVNATGTDRMKLIVIHTAKRPRDFGKTWQASDFVDYFNNTKAWMNMQVFETWVRAVNSRMASKRKNILILMDNASSHAIPSVATEKIHGLDSIRLSHVLIVFLPPNTTSKVQPLDAGIIAAFKQHYRGHLLRWYLNEYEQAAQDTNLSKLMPGVRQAILWSVAALEQITDQTIRNCWRKTGILPPTMSAEIVNSDEREKARDVSAAAELSRMISGLNLGDDALSADDFRVPQTLMQQVDHAWVTVFRTLQAQPIFLSKRTNSQRLAGLGSVVRTALSHPCCIRSPC
ncbi:hypothetical protein WJX77_008310 [Trebouxia sp. C0004]